jgi:hypothetical protein
VANESRDSSLFVPCAFYTVQERCFYEMQHGRPAPTTCRTKEAARYGMWGAVFVAGVTTLFVLLAIFGFSFMGIKPNALLDAVLFAGIAFGLSRYLPNRGRCTALLPPLTNRLSVSPLLATLTRMRGRGRGCYVSQRPACARTPLRYSRPPRSATHSTSATIFVLPYLPWGQQAR